jgi:hypothetical protein
VAAVHPAQSECICSADRARTPARISTRDYKLKGKNMAIQTLYNTAQAREAVIRAFQGNTTPIGWILVGQTSGYVFNPSGLPNQFGLVQDVPSMLEAIGGDSLLVLGSAGLAFSQGITESTTNGMLADDYAASQVLNGATFFKGPVVLA